LVAVLLREEGQVKMIGLFYRISSLLQGSFAKETYNFTEATNHCFEWKREKSVQRERERERAREHETERERERAREKARARESARERERMRKSAEEYE